MPEEGDELVVESAVATRFDVEGIAVRSVSLFPDPRRGEWGVQVRDLLQRCTGKRSSGRRRVQVAVRQGMLSVAVGEVAEFPNLQGARQAIGGSLVVPEDLGVVSADQAVSHVVPRRHGGHVGATAVVSVHTDEIDRLRVKKLDRRVVHVWVILTPLRVP